jgi:hypothetical protein
MQSKVWSIATRHSDVTTRDFILPSLCPVTDPLVCSLSLACKEDKQGFLTPQAPKLQRVFAEPPSTSKLHIKKKNVVLPLVDTTVRCSGKIHAQTKGLKRKTCFDRNCLACAPLAPFLQKRVVQNYIIWYKIFLQC